METLADYFIRHGARFPDDTIIIDASAIIDEWQHVAMDDIIEFANRRLESQVAVARSRPPFAHTFLQFSPDHGVYVNYDSDAHEMDLLIMDKMHGRPCYVECTMCIAFDENGYADITAIEPGAFTGNRTGLHLANMHDEIVLPHNETTTAAYVTIAYEVIRAFQHMHTKGDVEYHGYSRQVRRRAIRKLGKEPSPYFLLKRSTATRKRGKQRIPASAGQSSAKPRLHIVAGYFLTQPDDHPLPQFAGKTFWVAAHTRGNKGMGEVLKGYKLVQD